jgi:putative alpha-1,2-mannosidase
MTLDGAAYTKNYISHHDLTSGADIGFDMSDEPNKQRGTNADDAPYSFKSIDRAQFVK